MTSIRAGAAADAAIPMGLSDVSLMVQAIAVDLEADESDARADERECRLEQLEASRAEVREMRRESRLALASGLFSGVSQIAQGGVTLGTSGGTTENATSPDGTSPPAADVPPAATPAGGEVSTAEKVNPMIGGTSQLVTAGFGRAQGEAKANQEERRLEASVAEDARASARDAAESARDTIDQLRASAAEIARLKAETMSRILA